PGDSVGSQSEQLSKELRQRLNLYQVKYALKTPRHRQWASLAHVPSADDELTIADTVDEKKESQNETAHEEQP
ncbi:MAG: hypothetical protein AAF438_23060, partial [Pseudomonadota bacterium]